jgi:tetratricopeptide (TPR) repeat protein
MYYAIVPRLIARRDGSGAGAPLNRFRITFHLAPTPRATILAYPELMKHLKQLAGFALVVLGVAMSAACSDAAAQTAPEAIVQAAREAARTDRNAEAAELFAQALAEAPHLRRELLREYADQLTYSGQSAVAVPLYREVLGWELPAGEVRAARLGLALALSWSGRPAEARTEYERVLASDPGNTEARLGRARMLSWAGHLGPARAGYEQVLADDPANLEARRSLALVQAWRGRHGDAVARLDGLLREHHDDVETLLILAQVQEMRGRPDLAWPVLDRLLELRPDHDRALEFREELRRSGRPATGVHVRHSTQTDDLDIALLAAVHAVHPGRGRTTLEARYERYRYQQPRAGVAEVRVHRPGAAVRHRVGDRTEFNVAAYLDLIDPSGAPDRHRVMTWDSWLTAWPVDGVRIDVSSSRTVLDNIRSLATPVHATFIGASTDLTPDERTRLTVRGNHGTFSDGNRRNWAQAEVEHRILAAPQLLIGVRATGMGFDRQLAAGYFNPERYASGVLTARSWHGWGQRTWVEAGGSYGQESSTPGGNRPLWSADASLVHRVFQRAEVEVRFNHLSSRQLFTLDEPHDGGWARRTLRLGVRALW